MNGVSGGGGRGSRSNSILPLRTLSEFYIKMETLGERSFDTYFKNGHLLEEVVRDITIFINTWEKSPMQAQTLHMVSECILFTKIGKLKPRTKTKGLTQSH